MGIGDKLKQIMNERDTNANELAKKAGVSPQTIYSTIARNSSKIEIDTLIKLSKALGVNPEYFSDTGENITNPKIHKLQYDISKLNSEGLDKVIDYVNDLLSTGKYIKTSSKVVCGE